MKRLLYWSIIPIFALSLAVIPSLASASVANFTADGDITVNNLNLGDSMTTSLTILSGSTADSWSVVSGVLTITNPGSSFQLGSPNGSVGSILATRVSDGTIICADNSTPGTSSLTLTTNASDYTITPRASTCGGSGGGGGSSGVVTPVQPPAALGVLGSGKNVTLTLNSQTTFNTSVSGGGASDHTVKVSGVDLTNQTVTLIFQSNPVVVTLAVGETKSVDLNGDGVGDISVKLNSLVVNNASLTVTDISSAGQSLTVLGLNAGDIIKTSGSSAVYYVGSDGQRHLFSNEVTFWTWYSGSWSKIMDVSAIRVVKVISQDNFDKLVSGSNVTVKPASKLIKFENSPRVYIVTPGGKIKQVVTSSGDDSVAKILYGSSYKQKVILIQNSFESNYVRAEALSASSAAPAETQSLSDLF